MQAPDIWAFDWMSSHDTWQHLHASLADTGIKGCHLEWPQQETRFKEKQMKYSESPNVFGIANHMLVIGYDDESRHHAYILQGGLLICCEVSLKPNKVKCHFRCSSVSFSV